MKKKEKIIIPIIIVLIISAIIFTCKILNNNNSRDLSSISMKSSDVILLGQDSDNTANKHIPDNNLNKKEQSIINIDNTKENAIVNKIENNHYSVPVVLTTNNMAAISTEISGTVDEILIRVGDFFKKEDVILKFNCTLLEARTRKMQSDLAFKKKKFESISKLNELDGASKIELDTSRSDYEQAEAEYEMAKYNQDQCVLKAPFSGQLVELYVKEHETVKTGTRLYDIVDNSNFEIAIIVPSDWLMWIKKGDEFTLNILETKKSYKGKVDRIIYSVDAVSQSVKLIGEIDNKGDELFIGVSGEAIFKGPQ